MRFIITYFRKKKTKVIITGSTLKALVMLIAISKALAEKISVEKRISIKESMEFIVECILDENGKPTN